MAYSQFNLYDKTFEQIKHQFFSDYKQRGVNPLIHYEEERLYRWYYLMKYNNWNFASDVLQHINDTDVKYITKCKCGGNLIIRKNTIRHTVFLGCSNYPNCKLTYDL